MKQSKLLNTLPTPKKVSIDMLDGHYSAYGTSKSGDRGWNWVINTFITQQIPNYNKAIDYYYQKVQNFMSQGELMLKQQLLANSLYGQSIEDIFNDAFVQYNQKISDPWKEIQQQSTSQLQSKFNALTRQLDSNGSNILDTGSLLAALSPKTSSSINVTNIKGFMDLTQYINRIQSFGSARGNTRQLGGLRADIMGDLFEAIGNNQINNETYNLFHTYLIGKKNSYLPSGKIAQGKTDVLISLHKATIVDNTDPLTKSTFSTFGKSGIPLEASMLFDLTQGDLTEAYLKYYKDGLITSGMLGISAKATINKPSLGSFARSASEFRNRRSIGISKGFAHQEDAENYTAYIISKYLINVIGVYNGLIMSGNNGIEYTYQWLYNLFNNGYHLYHSIKMKETIPRITSNKVNIGYRK